MTGVIYNPSSNDKDKVMAYDKNGMYLGWVNKDDHRIKGTATHSPPNRDPWVWNEIEQRWDMCWFILKDLKPSIVDINSIGFTTVRPPSMNHTWDTVNNEWIDPEPLRVKINAYKKNAVELFEPILRAECSDEREFNQAVIDYHIMLSEYWVNQNRPNTSKVNEYLALLFETLADPDIIEEDARAAFIQFNVNIKNTMI
jgi:hypothetical protein